MGKIQTNKWYKFKISEIFETIEKNKKTQVPTGANIPKKLLVSGKTPRITVSNKNNGISDYFDCKITDNNYRIFSNFISVSFLGTVFYHPYEATLDMKVHCLKPINIDMNKYVALYLVSVIKKAVQDSSYSDQISSTSLANLEILLPITIDKLPDWSYIESFMRNIELKVISNYKFLQSIDDKIATKNRVNTQEWEEFNLYRIFDIDPGTKLDKSKMDTSVEKVNFVGRSNFNNGITQKVNEIDGIHPYEAGNLTLALGGAYLGSCFVQKEPFYTSQNVVVLIPKEEISFEAKQFIATTIFKESQNNYRAFIKELNTHIKKDFKIKLPVDSNKNPDYDYMTSYMSEIIKKTQNTLYSLI